MAVFHSIHAEMKGLLRKIPGYILEKLEPHRAKEKVVVDAVLDQR
jgi:hypothetical protein